jgi:hypothetical protein
MVRGMSKKKPKQSSTVAVGDPTEPHAEEAEGESEEGSDAEEAEAPEPEPEQAPAEPAASAPDPLVTALETDPDRIPFGAEGSQTDPSGGQFAPDAAPVLTTEEALALKEANPQSEAEALDVLAKLRARADEPAVDPNARAEQPPAEPVNPEDFDIKQPEVLPVSAPVSVVNEQNRPLEPIKRDEPDLRHYRVVREVRFMSDGFLTTLKAGQILTNRSYDPEHLQKQGVQLEPCEAPELILP